MKVKGQVSALPGSYPIRVFPGETVSVKKVRLEYQGPAATLYLCWGLKKGTGDFNNGENLVEGAFAQDRFSVPDSPSFVERIFDITASLFIPLSAGVALYDTYVWLSTDGTAQEGSMVDRESPLFGIVSGGKVLDTDSGVVEVLAIAKKAVRNLEVAYAKA